MIDWSRYTELKALGNVTLELVEPPGEEQYILVTVKRYDPATGDETDPITMNMYRDRIISDKQDIQNHKDRLVVEYNVVQADLDGINLFVQDALALLP